MSARDLIQGDNLGNLESLPPRLECLIDRARSTDLSVSGNIVAADKEDSGVNKHKLPERNLRPRSIGRVGRDRAVLGQYLHVAFNVRPESHFDDVMNSIGSQCADTFDQVFTCEQNLICPCSRCDFFVPFGAARGDDSRSALMRELDSTSAYRAMNSPMSGYAGNAETGTLF